MKFGVFDHVDRSGVPLHAFFEERLRLTEAYDQLGFYGYHVAEHHFTPLGMAGSPSVFLASVAQRTRHLRFGAMVYTLPLHHPLRLAEEICMLDQLSEGRLEVGIGRGISPIEAAYYGESPDAEVSRKVHGESLEILLRALSSARSRERISFAGQYRRADDVPMQLEPMQSPYPPLWMGINSPESVDYAARQGMNIMGLLPPADMRLRIARFRETWRATHDAIAPEPKAGLSFFVVVAGTDAAAQGLAARSYKRWHANFHYLYHLHGRSPVWGERAPDFAQVQAEGRGIAGSPATVLDFLRPRVAEAGINYLVGQFVFGDMALGEGLRSVELFAEHVMPGLRTISPRPAAA